MALQCSHGLDCGDTPSTTYIAGPRCHELMALPVSCWSADKEGERRGPSQRSQNNNVFTDADVCTVPSGGAAECCMLHLVLGCS